MANLDDLERVPMPDNERFIDLTGNKYGRLTVVVYAGRIKRNDGNGYRHYWLCHCECGKETIAEGDSLERGRTVLESCGCKRREGNHRGHFKE